MVDAVSVDDLIQLVAKLGSLSALTLVIVVVVLLVYVFYKRWLVLGPFYTEQGTRLEKTEQQRDQAIDMAAKLTDILEAGRRGSYRSR